MLKKNALKRILIASLALFVLLFVYFFPNQNNLSINESSVYIDALKMPIYLADKNKYVARINILKESENIDINIKTIINSLTEESKESTYLPNGFYPIIPKNTKLNSYQLINGILKLDFSKEFINITEDKEKILLESIIFSLCEFKEINGIMIFIEGEKLLKLPKSNEPLPQILDKTYGINKIYDLTSLKDTSTTINYYMAKSDDTTYYIPITKIENTVTEKVEIIISNLKTSPINQTNLISYLKASANLTSYEILEESINLSFDNNLIADLSSETIIEEVKYSIFLSVRDTYNVEKVIFDMDFEKKVSILLD